jgi:hypothetical protein
MLNINDNSIVIDGLAPADYPDFSDAFITYAEFNDGTPLDDSQLDKLNEEYYKNGTLYNIITDILF